jgi:type IV pilus assembly protein PilE
MRARARGLTLVEVAVGLAIVGIVASMALPSFQAWLAKGRRMDAIAALTQLQLEQERFRALHGRYGLDLAAGRINTKSAQGLYTVALVAAHPQSYIARASSIDRAGFDPGCETLTLSVADGVATQGPSARCWNR